MNRRGLLMITALAALLLSPSSSSAHELHLTYYAMGPIPFYAVLDSSVFCLAIVAATAVEALVMWACLRGPGFTGHLWRGSILYATGRIAEALMLYLLIYAVAEWASPGFSSSEFETFGVLGLCLAAGLLLKLLVASGLYRRQGLSKRRLACAVSASSAAGYAAATSAFMIIVAVLGS